MKTGSCLCRAVKYEVHGELRPVIACHCTQCRKQTGSFMHATACADRDFKLIEARGLKWYRASDIARRGFCGDCGSVLFWKPDSGDYISITAGSIDGPLGVPLEGHIYCADAGDYYEICGRGYRKQAWEY
jgi:hypothetical protein